MQINLAKQWVFIQFHRYCYVSSKSWKYTNHYDNPMIQHIKWKHNEKNNFICMTDYLVIVVQFYGMFQCDIQKINKLHEQWHDLTLYWPEWTIYPVQQKFRIWNKMGSSKNLIWALRSWVGIRWELNLIVYLSLIGGKHH